jgi:hypothetical protein
MANQAKVAHFNVRNVDVVVSKVEAPKLDTPVYKVTRRNSIPFDAGKGGHNFDMDTGEVQYKPTGSGGTYGDQKGEMYTIELSDNVRVTYIPHNGFNAQHSNNTIIRSGQGRMRVEVKDFKTVDDVEV